jgi:dihydrofolate reductase
MRKVILGLGISLDQYIARKNGAVDWLSMDWDYDWMAFFRTIDAVLMGRKTLEKAIEMSTDRKSNPYKGMATYVFSRKLTQSPVEGVELISGHLKDFVENLKAKEGKDIWLSGGGELAKSFLNEDLVDEIHLGITPILLGEGIPLFPDLEREIKLRLISNKTYKHKKEANGMVELFYEVIC